MYKVLNKIKSIDDDNKLKEYIRKRIYRVTNKTRNSNLDVDTIGSIVGVNSYEVGINNANDNITLDAWLEFIPKGQRIVYGTWTDDICRVYNRGCYYYLDDFTYIYDFVKYIKNKEINSIGNLIEYIHIFLYEYFGKEIDSVNRDRLYQLILENDKSYFKPVKEHSIKDFYHNGAARCTEYSAVAQNIMAFMNIDTLYLMDTDHAYNIIHFGEKYYILDYSLPVSVFSINLEFIKSLPFFVEIDDCDEEMLQLIVDRKNALIFDDFNYIDINGRLVEYYYNKTRRYACGGEVVKDNNKIYMLGEEEIDDDRRIILSDDEEKEKGIVLKLE